MARIEMRLTGDLGEMDFEAALDALRRGWEALTAVQRSVLGSPASGVRWASVSLQGSSAVAVAEGRPTEQGLQEADVEIVAAAFMQSLEGLAHGELSEALLPVADDLRDLFTDLTAGSLGELVVSRPDVAASEAVVIDPARTSVPPPTPPAALPRDLMTSVRGRLYSVNLGLRGAPPAVRIEDAVRGTAVRLQIPRELLPDMQAALGREVVAHGVLRRGGREPQLHVDRAPRVLPTWDDSRPLTDLVGMVPELTNGEDSVSWARRRRDGEWSMGA